MFRNTLRFSLGLFALVYLASSVAVHAQPPAVEPFKLTKMFFPDFDWGTRKINLTPDQGDEHALDLDEYRDGFRLIQTLSISPMFILMGQWNGLSALPPGVAPMIGLFPIVGGSMTANRFVPTQAELETISRAKLPFQASDLDGWREHDTISYQVSGGIVFNASVGMIGVGPGMAVVASGDWVTFVEKLDGGKAFVKVSKVKLKALGLSVGAMLATIDNTWFGNSDDAFAFTLDLSNPRAVEAYEDLVRGNMTLAQTLAADPAMAGIVSHDTTVHSKTAGRMLSLSMKFPFIYSGSIGAGEIRGVSDTIAHADGGRTEMSYAIFVKERKRRSLNRHRASGQSFYAGMMRNKSADGTVAYDTAFGTYTFSMEDDHASNRKLRSALTKLVRQTGLREELALHVPKADDLGYASLKFELTLDQVATDALERAKPGQFDEKDIEARALARVGRYLQQGTDPDRLCDRYTGIKGLDLAACREDLEDQARRSARKLTKALLKFQKPQGWGDPRAFTEAYAELGKAMTANSFVLHTALSFVPESSVQMKLSVEGERFSRLTREIAYKQR